MEKDGQQDREGKDLKIARVTTVAQNMSLGASLAVQWLELCLPMCVWVGAGLIPGQGDKIPHASGAKKKQNIKPRQYCNKFNGDFVLCDHLEGWDRQGGREGDARGKRYGNICICITDSLCYKAETNTPL